MAGRIHRLSTTVRRTIGAFAGRPLSQKHRAVVATMASLARADHLPGPADFLASFHPGYVHVRRVTGYNLWILYRFDATFLDIIAFRDEPPTPIDGSPSESR